MFITLMEIIDIIIMTFVVGFIFKDVFAPKAIKKTEDVIDRYLKKTRASNFWSDLFFASSVVAPAIIFHELGHKITALAFGMQATFHAAYFWLMIGIILKLISFPFLFFIPAYVEISGGTQLQSALTALAGPLVNLVFWIGSLIILRTIKKAKPNTLKFLQLFKNINMFLFIFNMLPIPMFDGFSFYSGMWHYFFG